MESAEEFTRASVKANLIDSKERESYFRKGVDKGWKKFYRAHPKAAGTVVFSSVGFNNKRTAAGSLPRDNFLFRVRSWQSAFSKEGSHWLD